MPACLIAPNHSVCLPAHPQLSPATSLLTSKCPLASLITPNCPLTGLLAPTFQTHWSAHPNCSPAGLLTPNFSPRCPDHLQLTPTDGLVTPTLLVCLSSVAPSPMSPITHNCPPLLGCNHLYLSLPPWLCPEECLEGPWKVSQSN
uniref:Uncharacterized protein n=1 Tax=Pipistrellus kuhlii TaxID=59472 RepID=A0A7J8A7V9_PIPKU|nr:hypothetical protein mPipKuh1_008818 [Pipistrellus kuhlii]